MNRFASIVICFSLLLVVGCQSAKPVKTKTADNNSSFMGLWNTYTYCQRETDYEQLKQSASVLRAAAVTKESQQGFVVPLPGKVERLVTNPTPRFAVDVKAMAASCSLRAAQAAIDAQKLDLARSLLESIFELQPQSDYAYYAMQAKSILTALNTTVVQVSYKHP